MNIFQIADNISAKPVHFKNQLDQHTVLFFTENILLVWIKILTCRSKTRTVQCFACKVTWILFQRLTKFHCLSRQNKTWRGTRTRFSSGFDWKPENTIMYAPVGHCEGFKRMWWIWPFIPLHHFEVQHHRGSGRHPRMALINSVAKVERQAELGALKLAACCCLRLSGQTAAMSDCCGSTAGQNYGRE